MPNFGPPRFEDELEPVEVWIEQMVTPVDKLDFFLHILIVFEKKDHERNHIVGGGVCEYYPKSNCGLYTYTATSPSWQRRGVGGLIVKHVLNAIALEAKKAGKNECDGIFLETNNPDLVNSEQDVMDPSLRHKVLQKLGFTILDFNYVQPALSEEQENCKTLLFAVHKSFLETKEISGHGTTGFHSQIILNFLKEFFIILKGEDSLTNDPDFLDQQRQLTNRSFIPIADASSSSSRENGTEETKKLSFLPIPSSIFFYLD